MLATQLLAGCFGTDSNEAASERASLDAEVQIHEKASALQAAGLPPVVLQPGAEGKDAVVSSAAPTVNFGQAREALAVAVDMNTTAGPRPVTLRSFIDFDLSSVPPQVPVHRATLILSPSPSGSPPGTRGHFGQNELRVTRVRSPWNEASITWQTQPAIDSIDEIVIPASTSPTQTYKIDVTSFVKAKRADPQREFGLALSLLTEKSLRSVVFASSDHQLAELRPTLVIELEPDCSVVAEQELLINDLSVVNDPARTTGLGAWTFGRLMIAMAPPRVDPADFTEAWVRSWGAPQFVNGQTIPARPGTLQLLLNAWPRTTAGKLDLARAPMRLLAIVYRPDLRDAAQGKAGEGRFVFGVLGPNGSVQQFTAILEYRLPAADAEGARMWAERWHKLGSLTLRTREFNDALQKITDSFAGPNAEPGRPNGSALGQLRTNEFVTRPWELREWVLAEASGTLIPTTVKNTPPTLPLDRMGPIADFINANEEAVLAGTHRLPQHMLGASSINVTNGDWLNLKGVNNPAARHAFAVSTCSGCHGREAAADGFLHISPRLASAPAKLSRFLTGATIPPSDGGPATVSDLARRAADLEGLLCPTPTPDPTPDPTPPADEVPPEAPEPPRFIPFAKDDNHSIDPSAMDVDVE